MIKKLCMVDDDADDRELFRLALNDVDPEIQFSFAQDGNEALKQIQGSRPDIVFLDCSMPGMDGIECLTKLKASRVTRHIPIIVYTGSANKEENELAIRLGAFQLLQKTPHVGELSGSIRQIISFLNMPHY